MVLLLFCLPSPQFLGPEHTKKQSLPQVLSSEHTKNQSHLSTHRADVKGGASGQKKEGESKQHVKNTTDTHSPVSNDSDSEGDVDERKRRPRHVPGAKGAAPPPQSALAKKLAASAACVPPPPAVVAHAASARGPSAPARPPTAASRPQPSRAQPVGEAKYPRLLVPPHGDLQGRHACHQANPKRSALELCQAFGAGCSIKLRFPSRSLLGPSSFCSRSAFCGRPFAVASASRRRPTWQSSFA